MSDKDVLIKIGARIKDLRIAKGVTQNNLAIMCDWDYQYLSRLESGNANMTIRTIIRICNALDVSLADFFREI